MISFHIVTVCLSRTISKTDGDFIRKLQNFPTPCILPPPTDGVPLDLGTGAVCKKLKLWRYHMVIKYQLVMDERTDRQTCAVNRSKILIFRLDA